MKQIRDRILSIPGGRHLLFALLVGIFLKSIYEYGIVVATCLLFSIVLLTGMYIWLFMLDR